MPDWTDAERRTYFARKDLMKRLGVRTYKSLLPEGPYRMKVLNVQPRHQKGQQGATGYELLLHLVGTDRAMTWLVAGSHAARWTWDSVVDAFDQVPTLVGREFVTAIGTYKNPRGYEGNQCEGLLVEVLED